jgi:LytR cell envelope-related transcriptional attenuator
MTRPPRAPAGPSRVDRSAARKRRRRVIAVVAAVAVAGTAAWMLSRGGGSSDEDLHRVGTGPGLAVTDDTLAISVQGAAVPLMAVVGGGPSMLTIPPKLSLEIPGVGSGSTEDVAAQPGADMRISLSNTVGMWVDDYAVLDLDGLATAIDRAGGVAATLPGPATLGSTTVGPGEVTLTGGQVRAYLGIDGPNAFTRWEVVLGGMAAAPIRLEDGDVVETDGLEGANAVLRAAKGGTIVSFPTTFVTDRTHVPDYERLDVLMGSRFGTSGSPVPVLVQNGAGPPGLGARVARLIVPEGFRVVLSQNADDFHHRQTQVVATGKDQVATADRARKALGVGVLAVTKVPSGLADVTIVIGKDFTA